MKADNFDDTLTQAEKDAKTFLEWSDQTLARAVRDIAKRLHDGQGFSGIVGAGAVLALGKVARDSNATRLTLEIDGTAVTVRIRLVENEEQAKKGGEA